MYSTLLMPVCTTVLPAHWGRAASQATQPRLPDVRSPNSPAAQVPDALRFATKTTVVHACQLERASFARRCFQISLR
jgi:hypothetical protein